jgi:hypothetical protein
MWRTRLGMADRKRRIEAAERQRDDLWEDGWNGRRLNHCTYTDPKSGCRDGDERVKSRSKDRHSAKRSRPFFSACERAMSQSEDRAALWAIFGRACKPSIQSLK